MEFHHFIKIRKDYAIMHLEHGKNFEIRLNDRWYQVGDKVTFTVVDMDDNKTGEVYTRVVTFVFAQRHFGLAPDYCIFSISEE